LFSKVKIDLKRGLVPADPEKKITRHHQSVTTTRTKGHLEIKKPAPMVPTYLVWSGKKSADRRRQKFLTAKTMRKPMNHLLKRPKTGTKSPKRRRDYNKTADGTSIIPIRVF
jgi:hypothetical protein